jgi:hypothetical protein
MTRKLFITPASMPEDEECRQLKIPSSKEWLGIFNAALLATTYAYNYEQLDEADLTPEECAAFCYDKLLEYFASAGCSSGIPTPYWDTDDDVDDEETAETQPWYGTVTNPDDPPSELTFVENASVWAFTGLLALATWEVGFAPALLFRTIAPRFVIATRRGDLGEIIRILVDGEEQARVDTSGYAVGEVIETPILSDPEIEEHEVLIVQVS